MEIGEDEMPVWDPYALELGGNSEAALENSRVILWKGHCSVHQVFRPEHVVMFREKYPDIKILVHPECSREVFELAHGDGAPEVGDVGGGCVGIDGATVYHFRPPRDKDRRYTYYRAFAADMESGGAKAPLRNRWMQKVH